MKSLAREYFCMKKIVRAFSVIIAPILFVCSLFAGCKGEKVDNVVDFNGIMRDINVKPEEAPAYEQYSRQAIAEYEEVAKRHTVDGDADTENEEVVKAASSAAAKLYAYACYNERTLDKYVYFSNQEGYTKISGGSADAIRQEYFLRVNESEKSCGYRYHYTLKKVQEVTGVLSGLKGTFESARLRVTDKTDLLYRFEGSDITIGEEHPKLGCNMLNCKWATGKDWGKPDVVMRKSEFIAPDKIEEDIVRNAGQDNITIRGNINILAENIVKNATIFKEDEGGCFVVMTVDTAVANKDEASLKMLGKANGSDNCEWVDEGEDSGLVIIFRLWGNGLFRFYNVKEKWSGKISGFNGTADSATAYYYSYSDYDCDMTKNLETLEKAKELKG